MRAYQWNKYKKPAVFLDRDGVLTEERSYVVSIENLQLFPFAAECIKQIHEKGYYAIVITNQSGVAKGLFTEEKLIEMNTYLVRQIGVDDVFYCPHHAMGRIEKYRIECDCRKPKTGMFKKACERFNVDMSRSFMVGDRACDIMAGKNAGMRTILLESGYGTARLERDVLPDYIFKDLRDVIEIL